MALEPRPRSPKSIGELQLSGKDTGEPRHIKLDRASAFGLIFSSRENDRLHLPVTYSLPSPKAGRWNLLIPPVGGILILINFPSGPGTALYAFKPASTSVTHNIPVPAWPVAS